jgi:hypothetical protein
MADNLKTPRFYGPDNVLRDTFIFTTDLPFRFFNGVIDADTVDMQVSIRGGAFTSDPDWIAFEGTEFSIPNPTAWPDGLQLLPGDNLIEARAILSNGDVSPVGSVLAKLSLERDVKASVIAPSEIFVERLDGVVNIWVNGLDDPNVTGYLFYASVSPGGGTAGYLQLTPQPVISGQATEDVQGMSEMTVDATVATNSEGLHAAEPLFLRVLQEQTDRQGTVIQTDCNQATTIPDTVSQIRTTVSISSVRTTTRYMFSHSRLANNTITSSNPTIPHAEFNAIPDTEPLYYVVTALYLIDGVEYESSFSPEVAAEPLTVRPMVSALPVVTREQIVRSTVLSIYRTHPEVDVKEGSVYRDTVIDPFSSEAERIRFVIGFIQAAQSFTTLLAIDDPGDSGTSVAVSLSPYKQALKQAFYLSTDKDVQNLIDNAFDHIAARRGVKRKYGSRANGELVFYLLARPAVSQFIQIGQIATSGGTQFRTTSAGWITPYGSGSAYSAKTGRWAVRLFIQASNPGAAGNVAVGQIRSLVGGPPGVLCYNDATTFGGTDTETNKQLATRADGVLSSVDTGTYRGYVQSGNDIPGVLEAKVVDAGNSLMLRDIDPSTGKHTGGKVDVWMRGESLATIRDSFAFSFEIVENGQFEPVGALSDLKFRAVNSSISADNPIIEMLDIPDWGYEFVDTRTGKVFDLTGVTIIPPDMIQLATSLNDPLDIAITDLFTGSYRWRTSNRHVFGRQPVREVTELVGEVTGTVNPDYYKLFAGSQPLDLGRSVEAGDYLQVIQPLGQTPLQIPSGQPVTVTGERHVMLDGTEWLWSLGINPLTVKVWNLGRTVQYWSPYQPGVEPDFTFVPESGEDPLGIKPTALSRITDGEEVLVDYEHDENFVVTYSVNAIVSSGQAVLDNERHATADVLAKETPQTGVDITATIVLKKNTNTSASDSSVRTALGRLFGTFKMGTPIRQSDVDATIRLVSNVAYVVLPLTKLAKSDESEVILEEVTVSAKTDWFKITDWSTSEVDMILLTEPLESGTLDGGGNFWEPRAVYFNEELLTTWDTPPDADGVPMNRTQWGAFIIGNGGLNIPKYSDDATLKVKYPFASDAEIMQWRITLTARRIIVALPSGTDPTTGTWKADYIVHGDTGVKNIVPGPIEVLTLGNLEFTYDEEPDFSSQVSGGTRSS